MRRSALAAMLVVTSCGGRTGLGVVVEGEPDAMVHVDAAKPDASDASTIPDVTIDADAGVCGFEGDPSPAGVSSYGACGEGINITSSPAFNVSGAGAAFEYVPETDVVIERIELHTTGGFVGLLDSDCELPGKVLFYGALENSATWTWVGAWVTPPITVKAGHRYFIYEKTPQSGEDSASTGGTFVREYTTQNGPNGPWDGPFSGVYWSARLDGVCP